VWIKKWKFDVAVFSFNSSLSPPRCLRRQKPALLRWRDRRNSGERGRLTFDWPGRPYRNSEIFEKKAPVTTPNIVDEKARRERSA